MVHLASSTRQITGIPQELEHLAARGADLNTLDLKHAHGRLLERRYALSGPFDDGAARSVNSYDEDADSEIMDPHQVWCPRGSTWISRRFFMALRQSS